MSRLPWIGLPVLGALLILLALNFGERDLYLEGSTTPPPPFASTAPMPEGIVREAVCACDCEHCHHLARVEQSVTIYRIVDSDGWYRLFWAGDDLYYYTDLSYFLQSLENRSWIRAEGIRTYTITFDRGCPHEAPAHDCEERIPARLELEYRLVLGMPPATPPARTSDPRIRIPTWIPGETLRPYACEYRGRTQEAFLDVSWALAAPPRIKYAPCRCPEK